MSHPVTDIDALLQMHHHAPQRLVQVLRELQAQHGWLSRTRLKAVADGLHLPLAHVEGVAGFYRFFQLQPAGEYRILFSDNITDRLLGSEALMQDLCLRLGVAPNATRADDRVSVAATSCTGMCDQGPAALINHHQVVTRLTPARIAHMAALIEDRTPVANWPAEWFHRHDRSGRRYWR